MRAIPTQDRLREVLDYNRDTGLFTWKKSTRRIGNLVGSIAGTVRGAGYIYIGVDAFGQFAAHRLAWVWCFGDIPCGIEVDHIDGNPANNAIANLRLATSTEQKRNKGVQRNNRSGLKGAFYHACRKGKKWRSQIKVGLNLVFLGYHETAEQAHQSYLAAANRYFGEHACQEANRLRRVA